MNDCKVFYTYQTNNKESQKLLGMVLYTGKAIVKTKKGKYLYSVFSSITRTDFIEAINDIKIEFPEKSKLYEKYI